MQLSTRQVPRSFSCFVMDVGLINNYFIQLLLVRCNQVGINGIDRATNWSCACLRIKTVVDWGEASTVYSDIFLIYLGFNSIVVLVNEFSTQIFTSSSSAFKTTEDTAHGGVRIHLTELTQWSSENAVFTLVKVAERCSKVARPPAQAANIAVN